MSCKKYYIYWDFANDLQRIQITKEQAEYYLKGNDIKIEFGDGIVVLNKHHIKCLFVKEEDEEENETDTN